MRFLRWREPAFGFRLWSPMFPRGFVSHLRPSPGGATFATMPEDVGSSGRSVVRPILPRPSERRVSRCFGFAPFVDLTCVITSLVMPRPRRRGSRRPALPRPRRRLGGGLSCRLLCRPPRRSDPGRAPRRTSGRAAPRPPSGRAAAAAPSTVAFTRLIGFWVPSDFDSTSRMPASSSTARTPPPAMTPVPSEAGFRNTRAGAVDAGHLVGDRGAVHRHLEQVLLARARRPSGSRAGPRSPCRSRRRRASARRRPPRAR